jgi:thiamine-phosphate pyrophosphorylase
MLHGNVARMRAKAISASVDTRSKMESSAIMKVSLTLITPIIRDESHLVLLKRAMNAAPFASVWIALAAMDEKLRLSLAKTYIAIVQEQGAAAIVDAPDPRFAARSGADGLHGRYSEEALDAALSIRPDRILGFGGLKQRDDAMTAGENADYVMFGEPAPDGYIPPIAHVVDRCTWWAEIFETPCIGYAPDLAAVPLLSATGAEFVALGPWVFADAIEATVAAAQEALIAK